MLLNDTYMEEIWKSFLYIKFSFIIIIIIIIIIINFYF